jgi:hypothetical protein
MRRMPTIMLAVLAATLLGGCGDKKIEQEELESKAQSFLDDLATQRGGTNAAEVSCPGDLDAKKGEETKCTASDKTGELTIRVRVNSIDGDTSRLSFVIE